MGFKVRVRVRVRVPQGRMIVSDWGRIITVTPWGRHEKNIMVKWITVHGPIIGGGICILALPNYFLAHLMVALA